MNPVRIRDKRIVVGMVAAILLAVLVLATTPQLNQSEKATVPERLPDGTPAIRIVRGEEAVRLVRSIHWSPSRIGVVDAAIATYSSGARIWVAVTTTDPCRLAEEMAQKMSLYAEELPYTTPVSHRLQGKTVYLSLDKRTGGLHAFWCTGHRLVWVELPPSQTGLLRSIISTLN